MQKTRSFFDKAWWLILSLFSFFMPLYTSMQKLQNTVSCEIMQLLEQLGTCGGREEDAVAVEKEKQVGLNDNH